MFPHERLTAWHKAHEFTLAVVQAFERPSKAAHLVVVNQLQRSAITVCTRIVEGSVSATADGFVANLDVALVAVRECRYLIGLASDLGAIRSTTRATLEARCDQVGRLLGPLKRHVERSAGVRGTRQARHVLRGG